MDDLSEKISSLLSDEETVKELKTLADSLGFDTSNFGPPKPQEKQEKEEKTGDDPLSSLGLDPAMLLKITSALKGGGKDEDTALLTALKPHLSQETRKRVDEALKIIRLLNLLPLLKELNLFGGGEEDG